MRRMCFYIYNAYDLNVGRIKKIIKSKTGVTGSGTWKRQWFVQSINMNLKTHRIAQNLADDGWETDKLEDYKGEIIQGHFIIKMTYPQMHRERRVFKYRAEPLSMGGYQRLSCRTTHALG